MSRRAKLYAVAAWAVLVVLSSGMTAWLQSSGSTGADKDPDSDSDRDRNAPIEYGGMRNGDDFTWGREDEDTDCPPSPGPEVSPSQIPDATSTQRLEVVICSRIEARTE